MIPEIHKQKMITWAASSLAKRPARVVLLVVAGIVLLGALFFCRKPVILVTDRAFIALYGEKRTLAARFGVSLRLFRPVKTISMADGAGPDLVAQGAASLSRRPIAVFFPYRYREGARHYLTNRPDIPVIILAGRYKAGAEDVPDAVEPLWMYTDTETDLYRAGIFAGAAGRFGRNNPGILSGQSIAVFEAGLGESEKAAFTQGLAEQEWIAAPLFSVTGTVLNPLETENPAFSADSLACAVVLEDFRFSAEQNIGSFVIFSWIDPALTPRRTLAIFDDSPWAQIVPALGLLKKGAGTFRIPSKIRPAGGDKTLKSVYAEIKKLKRLTYRMETADN